MPESGDATKERRTWTLIRRVSQHGVDCWQIMDCEVHIPLEGFEVVRVVEQGSPTEREATVLREHYLAGIECDHEHQRDRASCGCSLVDLGWHDSVGEARESWITHVVEVLRG